VPDRPDEFIELHVSGDRGWLTPWQTISLHHKRDEGWFRPAVSTPLARFERRAGEDGPLLRLTDFRSHWRNPDELVISVSGVPYIIVHPASGQVWSRFRRL
jgi:hypothetical protein